MNRLDIFLLAAAAVGAVRGYRRGFIVSAFGILALAAASFWGVLLVGSIIKWLKQRYAIDSEWLPFLAFSIGFLAIFAAVKFIGHFIKKATEGTAFGGALDGPMGAALGILKIMFWASLLFWLINSTRMADLKSYAQGSVFYSPVTKLAPGLAKQMSVLFPALQEALN